MKIRKIYHACYTFLLNFLIINGIKKSKGKKYYVSRVSLMASWVYVSYIPEVLYQKHSKQELLTHQNQQEMLAMVEIFNKLGYNVFVQDYSSSRPYFPKINVELVFGLEPVFEQACLHYQKAKKIYYATGAYYKFHNDQLKKFTTYVNKKCNSNLSNTRYATPHNSHKIADEILQIGSRFTIQTYPKHLRNKITLIHQSTQEFATVPIQYARKNEFLFVASEGNILKGCFLLIEYFRQHPELTLHWVGPIEKDFRETVSPFLSDNIRTYGFLKWSSDQMHKIVKHCNYIIYMSGTEGGCPGAVLCAMKNGLIPIVSKPASFDEIDRYGYLVADCTLTAIDNAVQEALKMPIEAVSRLKKDIYIYIYQTYTIARFYKEFEDYIKDKLIK